MLLQVDCPVLDFASQRSRIAVKNPRVRPPKNPRSLLLKPSADPTPPLNVPGKGIPGMGIGFKLPGRKFTLHHIEASSLDLWVCLFS